MSVDVRLTGHLGNNLFQYLVGRDLASRSGLAMTCGLDRSTPYRLPRMGGPWTLADLAMNFPNAPLRVPGLSVETPIEAFEVSKQGDWSGQILPRQAFEAAQAGKGIRLKGHFQRFEYVAPAVQQHRDWFETLVQRSLSVTRTDVLVDVWRPRDYGLKGWLLPMSYYLDALAEMPHIGEVFVVGTGIDDEVRAALDRFKPVYLELSAIERFSFARCFKRCILSNSTLSWWSALLSDATEIYAPRAVRTNGYAFTGFGDVDLHMRSSRYVEVPVEHFVSASYIVESHLVGASLFKDDHSILVAPRDGPSRRLRGHRALALLRALIHGKQTTLRELAADYGLSTMLLDELEALGMVTVQGPDCKSANT